LRVFDIIPVAKFGAKIRSGTLKTEKLAKKINPSFQRATKGLFYPY